MTLVCKRVDRLGVTSIDLVCIKELEEDEVEEHHFVEA